MSNLDWDRIQELFLAAADLAPAERARYLAAACGQDDALRREVESLLAADRDSDREIGAAVEDARREVLGADPLIGSHLGPWRVVREIGRGGMGAVYLAERANAEFRQQAAIKLVKPGMDTAELLERFRHERQILANLDHPFIARLIDGGSTPEGRPYLVMEYVDGQPIDSWCRERNLGFEDRCRLFLKVCQAVSYAHASLVVHRDLKPGNIFITPSGDPKLLDFGVAKLLTPNLDPGLTAVPYGLPLTPDYASPEQLLGRPVTTVADVYSLGAVLYELLTGSKAHRVRLSSAVDRQPGVCETAVPNPSQSVAPDLAGASRLRRRLAGDLDNIILMAMRHEPERRYSSVDQFSNDVRRFLEHRAVLARRDSVAYRAGKFISRHVVSVGLASLLALCLLGGALLAIHEAHRAETARQLAETARQLAETRRLAADADRLSAEHERARASDEARRSARRLTEMVALANNSLFDIHSQIERLPGATEARRQIVETTLKFLEMLSRDAATDEPLQLAVGSAYLKLGDVQGYPYGPNLGDSAGALKSYRAGSELLEPLHRLRPSDPAVLMPWVETQRRMAALLTESGKAEEAVLLLQRAVPYAVRLGKLRPADPEAGAMEGLLAYSIANALRRHDSAAGLNWSRRALTVFAGLAARFPQRESLLESLADAHSQVGAELATQGRLRLAMAEFEQSAGVRERLLAAHPNDVVTRRNLMLAYAHLADVLGNPFMVHLGETAAARAYYQKAVALAEQNALADEQNRTAQYDLAAARLRLGVVDVPQSGLAESLEILLQSAAAFEKLSLADPRDLRHKQELATAQEFIAQRLVALDRLSEAVSYYRQSLAGADAILAIDPMSRSAHSQALASGRGLALALATQGDREAALAQAHETIARAQAGVAARAEKNLNALYMARGWLTLAAVHRVFSDWKEVQAAAESALQEAAAGGDDRGLLQASAEARRLLADCRGKH